LSRRPASNFSRLSSVIALSSKRVAALLTPRILADIVIIIAPIAGWITGDVGKEPQHNRPDQPAQPLDQPDFSANRMRPSQSAMTPTSGNARSMTADWLRSIRLTNRVKFPGKDRNQDPGKE